MSAIKTTITTIWNSVKSTISTVVNAIKTTISTVFNAVKSTVSTTWDGIKNAITEPIKKAKDKVKEMIDAIKGFFSGLDLNLPKIKLPHFKIEGSLSLDPPSVPKLKIDWYAKGGILNRPTIFGQSGGRLLGGGEAGPEAVLPISLLKEYIDASNEKNNERLLSAMEDIVNRIISVLQQYLPYLAQGTELRLDSGALVAAIAPAMNRELGKLAIREARR